MLLAFVTNVLNALSASRKRHERVILQSLTAQALDILQKCMYTKSGLVCIRKSGVCSCNYPVTALDVVYRTALESVCE